MLILIGKGAYIAPAGEGVELPVQERLRKVVEYNTSLAYTIHV